jgi:hypothetical protein
MRIALLTDLHANLEALTAKIRRSGLPPVFAARLDAGL